MKTENMSVSSPKFVMLVGPPGVGKSTYFKNCIGEIIDGRLGGTIVRVSSDDYIEEKAREAGKTYTEVFKSAIAYASESSKRDFKEAIENKSHIVWDQTNLGAKKRKGILTQIPKDYIKICVYWSIENDAKWKKQLIRPGKVIPESVLKSMLDTYEHPTYNEGWDKIVKEILR